MTIKIGITGGIASGKTTVSNFLKKKKIAVHDSDFIVNKIYLNPTKTFLTFLKNINLSNSIKNKKINKKIIRDEIFNNQYKKRKLEKFIHNEVKKSRNIFLKKHKKQKSKIVILDIPLLFEAKLTHVCDYIILLYSPKKIRIKRAMNRRGMNKKILLKILNNQTDDKKKKTKADFVVNTTHSKKRSFKLVLETINRIIKLNA